MKTITLSVPDELKEEMSSIDWVNWSSVARSSFVEKLKDIEHLELKKRTVKISEIPEFDIREVNDKLARDVVRSVEKTIKSGKKPMTLKELDELLGLK